MLAVQLMFFAVAIQTNTTIHVMAGEANAQSIVFQARLEQTAWVKLVTEVEASPWLRASERGDYIVKHRLKGSLLSVQWMGEDGKLHEDGPYGSYNPLPGTMYDGDVKFAVANGMNYFHFFDGPKAYEGPDKDQGYPALDAMIIKSPYFTVFMGDNVYYDRPANDPAKTLPELRQKWHEQLELPRMRRFLLKMPTYWIKDDHDFRYNDSDRTGSKAPSTELGIATFREQVPLLGSGEFGPTYRTHRVTKHLQIWMIEGRDYRSPNSMPDGSAKTIWGAAQKAWLKKTLLESDARWKILLTPTPMVGPDDGYKKDNHTNIGGFRHEGEEFFKWAAENSLQNSLVIVCGDRHWQYHSIHPSGFHEFSAGALIDANSRIGRAPGDPNSTDPDALVEQIFTQKKASGGFLIVRTTEQGKNMRFEIVDEQGKTIYSYEHKDE